MAKALRILAIVLMAVTALVTVVSGVGTVCAAFTPEKYGEAMAALVPYKWLYQLFVVVTIAAGLAAAWMTWGLARARRGSYSGALVTLLAIIVFAGIHIATSRALRGKSMPNDLRLYVALFTLLVFLALRIPGIWNQIGFTSATGGSGRTAAGASLFVGGLILITAPLWASADHLFDGYNLVNVLQAPLLVGGGLMALAGVFLLAIKRWPRFEVRLGQTQREASTS